MFRKKSVHLTLVLLLFVCTLLRAQRTSVYIEPEKEYKTGLELFDKKKYNAALTAFDNYVSTSKNPNSLVGIDAKFYAAACAIELFHKDGEWRMKEFIKSHPESNKVKTGYFYLGKSNFRKKKYYETIEFLEKVEIFDLSKEDLAELYFKKGYSYFDVGNMEKAKVDLYEIKDVDNKYAHPANYYYSHIAYTEKNYQTALDGFNRLINNETFGSVVPFYITQIYFNQGKYDEVVKMAPPLLNDSNFVQKKEEINRIIGESYFKLKDYNNAIPYLLKHNTSSAEDNYQLGYAYYYAGNCDKALPYLELASANQDSLAQNAFYHAAGCYLKVNDKTKARSAFYNAYNLNFDKNIKEESLFNFAVLSYEQGFSPFSEAIQAFQKYITEYPNSTRKDEAYTYLVNCAYFTKNYTTAINIIDKIKNPDIKLKTAYQKMHYFKGVEFYNNIDLDSARKCFLKAILLNTDLVVSAQAAYWNSEIHYQKREYTKAMEGFKAFQLMPGAFGLKEYDISNYNIAYCYFNAKNYDEAGISFRKFLTSKNTDNAMKVADANVRTGDCYFVNAGKSENTKAALYGSASDHYETAIALNKIDVDYSTYQKAMCDGLLKNYNEKISGLKSLEKNYPNSTYMPAAIYEIAESYNALKDNTNAIVYYKKTMDSFPNSSKVNDCIISIGLLYYNQKQDDKAFEYFDMIVKKDPKSDAAQSILPNIKEIFKVKNDPEGLEAYFAAIGSSVNTNELDAQYYEKARKYYYEDKSCDLAFPEMQKYISKFPTGKFISEANFCMAECAYSKENYTDATKGYEFIIAKPRSIFSETSLQKASYIYYKDKNFEKSLPLYIKLQEFAESPQNKLAGKLGAMRSAYYAKKYDVAVEEANKVLNTEKISLQQTVEGKSVRAKSLFETNRKDEAVADLKYLTKNAKSELGAEAYYMLAQIQFEKKDYKEVEKTVNSLFNYPYSTQDWNTKAMLMMADVYIDKGEEQNAEAVLQTIIDNTTNEEYINMAKQKLQVLKDKQNMRLANPVEEDMKVEFNNSGSTNLFETTPAIKDTLNNAQPK
ncbi:MAG: tetratricopeptide repeat protein [Bacteroidota bacterium]|nr:tetratricopeptide repeat protein [Bacteroidota bacterium]